MSITRECDLMSEMNGRKKKRLSPFWYRFSGAWLLVVKTTLPALKKVSKMWERISASAMSVT